MLLLLPAPPGWGLTMLIDLAIRCHCGAVRGVLHGVSAKTGNRAVCYCDDCQAFANYLSTERGILDEHGGTDIFQVSPAHLKFTHGVEHIACLRLTPKGTFRWYTECCRTPIGNTLPTNIFPFVGLIHSCLDTEGRPLDEVLGPVRFRVMAQYAIGDLEGAAAYDRFPVLPGIQLIFKFLYWRIRGDHKHSPFFDPDTGNPIAVPRVIHTDGTSAVSRKNIS